MVHGGVSVYWAEGIYTTEFCSKTEQHGDRTVSNAMLNWIRRALLIYPNKSTIKCIKCLYTDQLMWVFEQRRSNQLPHNEIWKIPPKTVAERLIHSGYPLSLMTNDLRGISNGKRKEILPQITQC